MPDEEDVDPERNTNVDATLTKEQLAHIDEEDLTIPSFAPYYDNTPCRIHTPITLVSFNANVVDNKPTEELSNMIRKPNVALIISDARMTKGKIKTYQKLAANAQKRLIAKVN